MSEFEEIRIKCEYNFSGVEEEVENKPFDNFSVYDYTLTKQEEVFYILKFNDYFQNFATSNLADDCLDTKIIDKIVPEKNESDHEIISEPSTSSGKTLGSRAVKEWNPTTRLGRMVKNKKYNSIKEIRQNDLIITERSIVNFLLGPALCFEVLYVKPFFDQFSYLRGFTSCSCVGDRNGHFGYSIKYDAIRDYSVQGSIARATVNVHPVKRLPYIIDNKKLYTVPFPVSGASGNIVVKLIPEFHTAENLISNYYVRAMLNLAGIDNCVVEIQGCDSFFGNIPLATYEAVVNLYDNQ